MAVDRVPAQLTVVVVVALMLLSEQLRFAFRLGRRRLLTLATGQTRLVLPERQIRSLDLRRLLRRATSRLLALASVSALSRLHVPVAFVIETRHLPVPRMDLLDFFARRLRALLSRLVQPALRAVDHRLVVVEEAPRLVRQVVQNLRASLRRTRHHSPHEPVPQQRAREEGSRDQQQLADHGEAPHGVAVRRPPEDILVAEDFVLLQTDELSS